MDNLLKKFKKRKELFDDENEIYKGEKIVNKIAKTINDIEVNLQEYDNTKLTEKQIELEGYFFYLADYTTKLERILEQIEQELKQIKANRWDEIYSEIKEKYGKVQNKEQVESVLIKETKEIIEKKIFYNELYSRNQKKERAVKDIINSLKQYIFNKKN